MNDTTSAAAEGGNPGPELQAVIDDIAALRRDMAVLARHLSATASEAASGAAQRTAEELREEATRLFSSDLFERGRGAAKSVGHEVEMHPALSLLAAFGLGLIGGRLLSR